MEYQDKTVFMCELLNGNMFPYEFPLIFLSMAAEQEQSPNLLDF